jgi:hypothetical protein
MSRRWSTTHRRAAAPRHFRTPLGPARYRVGPAGRRSERYSRSRQSRTGVSGAIPSSDLGPERARLVGGKPNTLRSGGHGRPRCVPERDWPVLALISSAALSPAGSRRPPYAFGGGTGSRTGSASASDAPVRPRGTELYADEAVYHLPRQSPPFRSVTAIRLKSAPRRTLSRRWPKRASYSHLTHRWRKGDSNQWSWSLEKPCLDRLLMVVLTNHRNAVITPGWNTTAGPHDGRGSVAPAVGTSLTLRRPAGSRSGPDARC